MNRTYNLQPEQAKAADNIGTRITETGKYIGVFTRAEAIRSKQDTEGVEFAFKSNSGQDADFLTLWTHDSTGKEVYGLKMLNAVMTCMRVKTITPVAGHVEKWDGTARNRVPATIYPELMGKKIGLLLQREEYEKSGGGIGSKFNIYGCFEADSELMASEIFDKATKPEKLAKVVATLADRPARKKPGGSSPANQSAASGGSGFADMDDDIPFTSCLLANDVTWKKLHWSAE
jgi:hypothetical protein